MSSAANRIDLAYPLSSGMSRINCGMLMVFLHDGVKDLRMVDLWYQ